MIFNKKMIIYNANFMVKYLRKIRCISLMLISISIICISSYVIVKTVIIVDYYEYRLSY